MNKKKRHLIFTVLLIAATVSFIWINSALSGADSSALSGRVRELLEKILVFIRCPESIKAFLLEHVRKAAHAVEYAVIGLELAILWAGQRPGIQGLWNAWSGVLAIAVFDETIQLFATERGPQITDILLDTAGGSVSILIVYIFVLIGALIHKTVGS